MIFLSSSLLGTRGGKIDSQTWNRENDGKRPSNFEVLQRQRRGEMRDKRLKESCSSTATRV
ncbi:unnamed protein product [Trifolium pratense]|uniref:Uncharacterized protein n=1 Tax=Trifolium pratense TaxID=57577 RepID=A0ACB0L487_TRIPR|nr:unnamed protein product [Trifolium pratense]